MAFSFFQTDQLPIHDLFGYHYKGLPKNFKGYRLSPLRRPSPLLIPVPLATAEVPPRSNQADRGGNLDQTAGSADGSWLINRLLARHETRKARRSREAQEPERTK